MLSMFVSAPLDLSPNPGFTSLTDKPIAGEVVVAILGFKGIIGFALAFGTNLWVDTQGYQNGQYCICPSNSLVLTLHSFW